MTVDLKTTFIGNLALEGLLKIYEIILEWIPSSIQQVFGWLHDPFMKAFKHSGRCIWGERFLRGLQKKKKKIWVHHFNNDINH